jgi:hypothetical protein
MNVRHSRTCHVKTCGIFTPFPKIGKQKSDSRVKRYTETLCRTQPFSKGSFMLAHLVGFLRPLWNPTAHHRVHKSPPLNQMNPVCTLPLCLPDNFYITHTYLTRSDPPPPPTLLTHTVPSSHQFSPDLNIKLFLQVDTALQPALGCRASHTGEPSSVGHLPLFNMARWLKTGRALQHSTPVVNEPFRLSFPSH